MTQKRFTLQDGYLFDDGKGNAFLTKGDCCELLNELHEENIMLKGEVAHYKLTLMSLEKEAKRLSQIR